MLRRAIWDQLNIGVRGSVVSWKLNTVHGEAAAQLSGTSQQKEAEAAAMQADHMAASEQQQAEHAEATARQQAAAATLKFKLKAASVQHRVCRESLGCLPVGRSTEQHTKSNYRR